MQPQLVDYLCYEPEDNGILWIKFNRPDRLNALHGLAEPDSTIAGSVASCSDRIGPS